MLPAREAALALWLPLTALVSCTSDATLTPGPNDFAAAEEVIDPATFDGDCGDFMPVDEVGARWTWIEREYTAAEDYIIDVAVESVEADFKGVRAFSWSIQRLNDAASRSNRVNLYLRCDRGDIYLLGGRWGDYVGDCPEDLDLRGAHTYNPPYRLWSTSGFESGDGWNTRTTDTVLSQVMEPGCTGEVEYEESQEFYFPIYYTVAETDTIELPGLGAIEATRVHAQDLRHRSLYYSDLWVARGFPILSGNSPVGLPWGMLPAQFYLASYQPAE